MTNLAHHARLHPVDADALPDTERLLAMYEKMVLIRGFETRILELFAAGELNGTTHTYVGQEANAAAVIDHLDERDILFSSHRCHGHYLARFGEAGALFGELMGRVNGVCAGRGGSQHLCRDNFYSNGIQGGYVPIAAGMAVAEKRKASGTIAVAFIGDGTLGEGNVYEGANLASLWDAPLLLVVENNRYAQTTPIELGVAGDIAARFSAFGIPTDEMESNDVAELFGRCGAAVSRVRESGRPMVLVLHTYRLNAHSKSDDFRPVDEIEAWRARDPLTLAAAHIDVEKRAEIEARVQDHLRAAEAEARAAPEAVFSS